MDYILTHQREDGWLGPLRDNARYGPYDAWPRFVLLKAMMQYEEATGDPRIVPAIDRFLRRLDGLLDEQPLFEWARARWADLLLGIHWLHARTREPWLLLLGAKVHGQGFDWSRLADEFPYTQKISQPILKGFQEAAGGLWINDHFIATHGVNVAMGLKAPAVWYRQSHERTDRDAVFALLDALDAWHGQATGVFTCDEHLAGKHPSQGTELCTVVECLFSLEVLLAVLGDGRLADRLERIVFNALPATFTSDMWAHQYDQQANQVVCKVSQDRIYTNNGPDANLFGLEPNFGCCTANLHQGWPKYAAHLWMRSPDGGLSAISYAPCEVLTHVNGTPVRLQVQTEYPFGETVQITVTADRPETFPLHLRIPAWADDARIAVGVETISALPGAFHLLKREWAGTTTVTLRLPMRAVLRPGCNNSRTVERGPLVFALKVGEDWRRLRGEPPHADWEVHPTTPWNYALQMDPAQPDRCLLRFEAGPVGACPFSPDGAPVRAFVQARRLPGWGIEHNAAAAPPQSPVCSAEPLEEIELIPYGCTHLRVTEFPTLQEG